MYDVISDEPEFHVHISEYFRSYSALISAKRFLTETEIQTVRMLCSGFGNFTKFFYNVFWLSTKHWKFLVRMRVKVFTIQ